MHCQGRAESLLEAPSKALQYDLAVGVGQGNLKREAAIRVKLLLDRQAYP